MASRRIGQPKHRNEALRLALLGESSDFLDSSNTGVLDPFDVGTPASYLKGYNGIAAIRSGTGTQDLTVSGIGTPIAIRWVITKASTPGTGVDHMVLAAGFAADDGLDHYATATSKDAVTNMLGYRRQDYNDPVDIIFEDGLVKGTFETTGATSGPITDGWRIDVTAQTVLAGRQIAYTLYTGTGRSATVINETGTTAGNTTQHVVGFQPGIGFGIDIGDALQNSSANPTIFTMGMFAFDGSTITQGSNEWGSLSGAATSQNDYLISTDAIGSQTYNAARTWHAEVTAADATSLSITARDGTTEVLGVLVMDLDPAQSVYCGNIETPTTADAAWAETGIGFEPSYMTYLGGHGLAVDTLYSGSGTQAFSVGSIDSSGVAWSACGYIDDNAATSDTKSVIASQFMDWYAVDGTASGFDVDSASRSPFTATGFQFTNAEVAKLDNQAGAGATARQMTVLAIGA